MKVVYLVYREGLSAVFPAMVLAPISALQRGGVEVELAVLSPIGQLFRRRGRTGWNRVVSEAHEHFRVNITRLPSAPTRARWLWSDQRVMRRWMRRLLRGSNGPVVVHCRGPYAAAIGLNLRQWFSQLRVIFDMRGITFAENLLARGLADAGETGYGLDIEARAIYDLECRVAEQADGVICVASGALAWLRSRCGVAPENSRVVLNSVDLGHFEQTSAFRERIRERLGVAGRFVVCYCGSLREWQQYERAIELFLMLKDSVSEAFFLGVTPSTHQLTAVLRDAGVSPSDCAVVSVPHSEVSGYLTAADLGIIARGLGRSARFEDRLSCPVKFGEYLAAGTPVLLGPDIGDCSSIAIEESVGMVMSPDEPDPRSLLTEYAHRILGDRRAVAERCRVAARRHLDLEQAADQILGLYRSICRQAPKRIVSKPSERPRSHFKRASPWQQ